MKNINWPELVLTLEVEKKTRAVLRRAELQEQSPGYFRLFVSASECPLASHAVAVDLLSALTKKFGDAMAVDIAVVYSARAQRGL